MNSALKVITAVEDVLNYIKRESVAREDGNTTALVDKILRDTNQLQLEYRSLTFKDMYGLASGDDIPGKTTEFTAQSYEKTGAQDVNKKPYPPTGEDASAPFVSKADTSVDEEGRLVNDPDKKSGVTKSGNLNADNPEEEPARTAKQGKGSKANT